MQHIEIINSYDIHVLRNLSFLQVLINTKQL